jgi:membrane protein
LVFSYVRVTRQRRGRLRLIGEVRCPGVVPGPTPRFQGSSMRSGNASDGKRSVTPRWLGGLAARFGQQDPVQPPAGGGRARPLDGQSPFDIPMSGWREIAWRVLAGINQNRLLAVAASVVFYGLLALFPAITAFVSLYALFLDPSTIAAHLDVLKALMPAEAYGIVENQITHIAQASGGSLSWTFAGGLLFALWSANSGMKAMIDALNVTYGETEKRGFIRLNLVSLAMTLAGLVFMLLAISGVVVAPLVLGWFGLAGQGEAAIALLRWPAIFVLIVLGLAALYRFGPSREAAHLKWFTVGAVVATLLWMAASLLFSWYLSNFANYNATYGSLGAAIGLMMWLWLTFIAVLLGAQINAEIENQEKRLRDNAG